ncbi:MAG: extracellular solute-binding protein [Ahrensia sp.]|nr:extracellular solute-binding protein [Ahrensia sp.]
MSGITRRRFGQLSAAAFLLGPLASRPRGALAANPAGEPLHGLSAFGELKYAAEYTHFDYVNPEAPKGGTFNFSIPNWAFNQNPQTFDTLNTFVLRGNAPPRMEMCFDALMFAENVSPSVGDEPSAIYGMLAQSVEISEDRNRYTFKLRPEARWHDGTPITAADVAFTYETFKEEGHPSIALALRHLEAVEVVEERTATLVFNGEQSDRAILTAAVMPIVSRAFYTANSFTDTTMTPPLGSGPYKVGRVSAGNFIEYERATDYWAKDMPFNVGRNNFDTIRIEFYRERQAAFEAFKKGDIHYRQEFTSKTWATEYDFPALNEGKVKRQLFDAEKSPSFQGWAVNRRRAKLADPRTVQAIGLCFDFEWTNDNLFFGAYARSHSYFVGSEFAASGKPSAQELALLEPLRDKLDPSVFDEAFMQPVSDGSGGDRSLLRRANALLEEAGWKREGRILVDAQGRPFTVEFLIRSPTFERILGRFVANLKRLGIEASIRLVDPAQYQARLDTFDFDITGIARSYGATPTAEALEQIFQSDYAGIEGSLNLSGLKDEAVDALIDKMRKVASREELTTLLRALDRVLRSTHSWIPNWHSANHRVAYWDMFGFPERKPDYAFPVEATWWFDAEKAKAIGQD